LDVTSVDHGQWKTIQNHNEDLPMIYHLDRFGGRISPFLASLVTNHKLSWKLQQTAVDPDETWLNSWSLTSDLLCLAKHDRAVTLLDLGMPTCFFCWFPMVPK